MYSPIYYANCTLVQNSGRYMIFTNTGVEIDKGAVNEKYISKELAKNLIMNALIKVVKRGFL